MTVRQRPRALDTILYGGLAVGVLDGLFAFVFYGAMLGVKPLVIFQSVAAGLLGRASYGGGVPTFLLGLFMHFIVAFTISQLSNYRSLSVTLCPQARSTA